VLVIQVVVYTKEGCHLCENVIASLKKMQETNSFKLSTEDITKDSGLFERFKDLIPVVEIDGEIRLAGVVLSDSNALDSVLRKALFSV
jgi:glutaredoxin